MKVTLSQIAPKLNRTNLEDIIAIVKEHMDESDLIIFPELALNGYLLQDKLCEDAWSLDELYELCELSKYIDIVVGAAVREGKVFRNSALYFSGGVLVNKHNKVHLPNYGMFEEARYFTAGEGFESFQISGMKIATLVCEDLWNANVHKQLFEESPDLIVTLVASPARGFSDKGLLIEDQWHALLKSAALHCEAKVIFVNRVGFEDGLGFWGGSCIIDKDAQILQTLPHYDVITKTFEI